MSDFRYELLNKDISMKDMFAERNIYQAYLDVVLGTLLI